jgi:C4-dicarboxylate-specific signal transduction histidine kinase
MSDRRTQPSGTTRDGDARRLPLTLGQWLALLIVAFFLGPLCLSNLWGYLQTRHYITEAAFRNIRNVAALEASETLEFVQAAENLVPSIVAGNQHLFRLLRTLASEEDEGARRSLTRELETHLVAKAREGKSVEEFRVISTGGVLVASSRPDRKVGSDLAVTRCFESGRSRAGIVGFDYSHQENSLEDSTPPPHPHEEPDLLVAAPINDSDGAFLGVFCARFEFDIHSKLVMAHSDRTSQANLYLLDEEGRIVCSSFETADVAYGEALSSLQPAVIGSREPWEGRQWLDSGEEIIAVFAPIPALGWGIAIEVPVALALADLERLKWQALGASSILALILGLAVVLGWRMVARPLRAFARASDRMASGNPGETVHPRGPREVVELGSAFNRMSLALKDSQDTLESRVAERTRELVESRGFSELLLDSIDQRVVVLDTDCQIIKANSAAIRMHGSSILGANCCKAFEGLSAPSSSCPARRTIETGLPVSDERSQRTLGGLEVVYVETYPVFDADGRVESVVEIGRIITAEKKLQVQMMYQEKMAAFGQLAAGLAHEIGNPLASIESQLQLAQHDPTRVDQTLEVVRKQVKRIDRMLRELVGFSRRKRDKVILVSVNQVVDDVVRLLEHDPRARSIRILCDLTDNLPGVRTTEDHLVQVLLNLGLNAFDAMEEVGAVEFETGVEKSWVTIRVRDGGCGIPEEARSHLFEPFFTTKPTGRGTGLGLFVSRATLEAVGGRLDLERTGSDGTTFVVRLRVDRDTPAGAKQ